MSKLKKNERENRPQLPLQDRPLTISRDVRLSADVRREARVGSAGADH